MTTLQEMTLQTVSPRALPAGAALIDVRTPGEFAAVHARGAHNLPLDALIPAKLPPGDVYLICKSGQRARTAAEKLRAAGRSGVSVVEGGTDGWIAAGLPVVRGRGVISLDRQVRIAAGLLVLAGVVLGWLISPWLYGLSAFVGAGLVCAGVTDTCGLAMVLARMPWNAGRGQTCTPG